MSEMVWLFLGLEGNVNHRPFPVGKLCQDGETGGSRNTLQKKYVKPRSSGFSPTKNVDISSVIELFFQLLSLL